MSREARGANLDAITIRPHHDTCVVRPRPDLHAALHDVQVEGGAIMTKMFGSVRLGCPITYKVTGKLNQFAFGEIISMGKGAVTGQGRDRPAVDVGDIVGFDLGQVGHVLPDGSYHVIWRNLLCQFTPLLQLPRPLMNNVMVEHVDELEDRFVFQKQSKLVLPKIGDASIKTNDRVRTRVGIKVARVLMAGHGRYVKKAFEEPDVRSGDVVAFMPHNGVVDFSFSHGRLFRFVPWSEVLFTVDGL